jgi:hypothetical protein
MSRGFGEDPEFSIEGWPVAIVWIVEVGLLFGSALLCARGDVRRPFCDQCLEWTTCEIDFMELAVAEREDSWPEGMNELVNNLTSRSSFAGTLRIDLATCPSCEKSNYISIYETVPITDRGRSRLRTRLLIRNAILGTEQTQTLKHARRIWGAFNDGTADGE